jgi:hypothetical protein
MVAAGLASAGLSHALIVEASWTRRLLLQRRPTLLQGAVGTGTGTESAFMAPPWCGAAPAPTERCVPRICSDSNLRD